jgi:UDP-N-acetylmuramate dehydrogenase
MRGTLKRHEPLAPYTTWRVGGPAERFYRPADGNDLVEFLRTLPPDEPLLWLGLGSNLLVRDGGFRGTVIAVAGALNGLHSPSPGVIEAEAGVACSKVARFAVRNGLSGAEFLAGIPGTLGGALAMNAGAWGGETWRLVESVRSVDRQGRVRERPAASYTVGYRSVQGPPRDWFLAARLALAPAVGDPEDGPRRIQGLLAERAARQPTGVASAGSVFRNPPGDYAARLIEACGLKGECRGGACVSPKHANFIVNGGTASAADIEALIELIGERVEREQGLRLQPEVRIVGERR